jgi:hypothetical protein
MNYHQNNNNQNNNINEYNNNNGPISYRIKSKLKRII